MSSLRGVGCEEVTMHKQEHKEEVECEDAQKVLGEVPHESVVRDSLFERLVVPAERKKMEVQLHRHPARVSATESVPVKERERGEQSDGCLFIRSRTKNVSGRM
jgi:hypothetical protein